MRNVRMTREERHNTFASPLVRAIGTACGGDVNAIKGAFEGIGAPSLMGGVWALPAPVR